MASAARSMSIFNNGEGSSHDAQDEFTYTNEVDMNDMAASPKYSYDTKSFGLDDAEDDAQGHLGLIARGEKLEDDYFEPDIAQSTFPEGTPIHPNGQCLLFQCMVTSITRKSGDNREWGLRRIRLPNGELAQVFWEDYVALYAFAVRNRISETQGDELLQLIKDISTRHTINIALPACFRTIRRAFDRHKNKITTSVEEIKVHVPRSMLLKDSIPKGSKDIKTQPPVYAIGVKTSVIESVSTSMEDGSRFYEIYRK